MEKGLFFAVFAQVYQQVLKIDMHGDFRYLYGYAQDRGH
jgi:hypothetical protein